jgi:uncharacterized protein YceK
MLDDTAYHREYDKRGPMRKLLLPIAFMTLLLAGCRVESNVILDIAEDGSAVVTAEVGFDEEFRQILGEAGANPEDLFADLPSFGDEDVVLTERVDGDMTFYGASTDVEDLSSFDMISNQGEVFTSFDYTFDDEGARLDATLSAADLGAAGGGEDLPFDPAQITDEFFSANVLVTMPGTVTESNADEVRGDGTLVWNLPFTGVKEITATSEFGGTSVNWVLVVLLVVLIVGIVAAVVATVVSRRESKKAVEAAAASHAAASAASDDDVDSTEASGAETTSEARTVTIEVEELPDDAPGADGDDA